MSRDANYFKLGLFVIGAGIAGIMVLTIIGTGRWLKPRTTIETYFNESVQGLDVGSKMKYRGVVIGAVTRISFTYVEYEQDKPMNQRKRYVLVEAQIEPRLVGGKAANDITSPESSKLEVERGLRVHLAPQGITGTNYLELDYVDPTRRLCPSTGSPSISTFQARRRRCRRSSPRLRTSSIGCAASTSKRRSPISTGFC